MKNVLILFLAFLSATQTFAATTEDGSILSCFVGIVGSDPVPHSAGVAENGKIVFENANRYEPTEILANGRYQALGNGAFAISLTVSRKDTISLDVKNGLVAKSNKFEATAFADGYKTSVTCEVYKPN